LSTTIATSITDIEAESGGDITSSGASFVSERGVCFSLYGTPTIDSLKTSDGLGSGTYTSSLSSLVPNTTYYYRAYATNSLGTAYGEVLTFTTDFGVSVEEILNTNTKVYPNPIQQGGVLSLEGHYFTKCVSCFITL
jgi:hypothetical protein